MQTTSHTTSTPATGPTAMRRSTGRRLGLAALTFVGFPIGGSAVKLALGAVDAPVPAVAGGLIAGAAIGLAQALGSSGRVPRGRWVAGTSLGLAAGLGTGAAAVDYETSLGALATMGAISGVGVGVGQALAWGDGIGRGRRAAWALVAPVLWALGWTITTSIGVDVDQQWAVFGSAGAIVASFGFGVALEIVGPQGGSGALHRGAAVRGAAAPAAAPSAGAEAEVVR